MPVSYLFDEVLLDPGIFVMPESGSPATGGPEYANYKAWNPRTGVRKVNVTRYDPQEVVQVNLQLLDAEQLAYLIDFWRGGYGSAVGFRVRVPHDHSMTLETIAGPGGTQIPNGTLNAFKIYKTYTRPGVSTRQDVRRIVKPVVQASKATGATLYEANGSTARKFDGDSGAPIWAAQPFKVWHDVSGTVTEITSGWTVNVTTGVVTYTSNIPATGTYVKVSCDFDTPMSFDMERLPVRADVTSSADGVLLREILYTELGIAA